MSITILSDDLPEEYQNFISQETFANNKLSHYIADVQRVYLADKRPWVIGYSGGKDSSAVMSLVYMALQGLDKEQRTKPIFVVSSDTLVETPVVVNHISNSLEAIGKGAKLDQLPITVHKVTPKTEATFWVNLLGKGYPAPTRSFRWCTERMKIDPVSDFIKETVSKYDEVIVVLGSRSQESASRAQVIAKHKIDGSRLARHTTLANAFIYTPIDTWGVDDVWKILRMCSLESKETAYGIKNIWRDDYELEWENPWGSKNLTLWNLYKDSSGQGECPMVIDETTPSCGNSRFGCWTCTVVTRDRAMESLILNGETWMEPLLKFRDLLAQTSVPENKDIYRNYKRRSGKVSYQYAKEGEDINVERKHVPGPYWLKYRQEWLQQLLQLDKQFKKEGREIELITVPELHAIRQHWLRDPNEPDWNDSLPQIFREVYGYDLDWVIDDSASFGKVEARLVNDLSQEFNVSPEMVMKLIEMEVSLDGLSRRIGVFDKLASILKQDWGSLENIKVKHTNVQSRIELDLYKEQMDEYNKELTDLDRLLSEEF
ncbi:MULTISPECIES: DNA phosphorothioation system sulfurtransferase DndC [Shewanella]|uniref:DNA phosphorothioation system sulfurtransferase DndC n=1 Tax=Shewanella TaxID=22 RepID=UPI000DFB14FE|nr:MULTISPECIES: DNA phosphorothioation system sulfurtransferase DndC [Shewanella]WVI91524.1 DNA phosphorothioation system sulfurtransferase DndC [Shewanella oncorhynchi]SUI57641.1 PUA domain (predicted RNA-binding domain) [Shewanella baltica]